MVKKHCQKKEKMLVTSIISFSNNIFNLLPDVKILALSKADDNLHALNVTQSSK